MRKICIVTGSRADYGLLSSLIQKVQEDPKLKLQLIVTGSHLSPEFGLTCTEIKGPIDKKIEILLSSNSPIGISKAMGLALISFAEAYAELKPDIVVVLGDRFEIFAAATAATVAQIPLAHIHGGETTEGAIDEAFRHSITKMAHLHFTAAEEYKNRVIQLGENPSTVYNVGGLGVDNIKKMKLLTKKYFEKGIEGLMCFTREYGEIPTFKLKKKNILVTYHPVTLEKESAVEQFQKLLDAMDAFPDIQFIITKANSDTEGNLINDMIDKYTKKRPNVVAFSSLGNLLYLSSLQFMDCVVGNSSSGLAEVPSFKIGTVNIGDRQKGRLASESVVHCRPVTKDIIGAIKLMYFPTVKKICQESENPYGNGGATKKILECLKTKNLEGSLKKSFYNIGGLKDA